MVAQKRMLWSVADQALASGGNWLFLVYAAQYAATKNFESYAILFVAAQFFQSLIGQKVYTPVSTFPTADANLHQMGKLCLKKLFLFIAISPIILWPALFSLRAFTYTNQWEFLSVIALACAISISDFWRLFLIRLNLLKLSFLYSAVRWLGSFAFASMLSDYTEYSLVLAATMGVLTAVLFTLGSQNIRSLLQAPNLPPDVTKKLNTFTNPVFVYGIVSGLSGILVNILLGILINPLAIAAYTSIKSLGGVASVPMQMINTHYASYLFARGAPSRQNKLLPLVIFILAVGTIFMSSIMADEIIALFYGPEIANFSIFLPFVIATVLFHIVSNYFAVQLRTQSKTAFYRLWTMLSFTGAGIIIIASWSIGFAYIPVAGIMIVALLQAVVAAVYFYITTPVRQENR